MLIPVARYTLLFSLFVFQNKDPHFDHIENEDQQHIYGLTACIAGCMQELPQQHQQYQQQQQQLLLQRQQELEPQLQYQYSHFENCFVECRNASTHSSTEESTKKHIRKIQENFSLNLICRDDRSLTFRIDLEHAAATAAAGATSNTQNLTTTISGGQRIKARSAEATTTTTTTTTTSTPFQTTKPPPLISAASPAIAVATTATTSMIAKDELTEAIFIIRIHAAEDAEEYLVFLSDDNFFTIGDLKNNTVYNITLVAMHASGEYSVIAKQQQYATLQRGFTPGMVKDIQVRNFYVDEANDMLLMAKIAWKPSADMTCSYNIICFAPESEEFDLTPLEIRSPHQLYTYNLENLTFSSTYKVGIRAKNPHNVLKESELKWETFTAPSCAQWYNYNFNICAPFAPDGMEVEQIFRGENEFSLNITWQPTQHFPDYFTARILDLSANGISFVTNVSKELTSLYIPKIVLSNIVFEVQLTAYTPGGSSSALLKLFTQEHLIVSDKHHIVKLISAILALIFCIAILLLTIFIVCHRRAKLKRYQERCKYFEELEKKAPIDPKAAFDFPTKKIFFIDAMEIDRGDITLYDVLGEGAFGLVRRGIYRDEKTGPREVAVKMLKDQASPDDVRAFRREIEVMKSVGKHPNIIGIIGHCTKRSSDMMLLTEYCSFGNLLDFLKEERLYLQKFNTKSSAGNNVARPPLPSRSRRGNKNKQSNKRANNIDRNNSHHFNNNNNNNNNSSNSNNNNKNHSNALKIDATLIERLKSKYKSLNEVGGMRQQHQQQQQQQQHSTKEYHQTTENTAIRCIEDIGTTAAATAAAATTYSDISTARDNKSYGYNEICTNACKCQVDVVTVFIDAEDAMANVDPSDSQRILQQQATLPTKTIEIKNCNCQPKRRRQQLQLLLAANNKRNAAAVENKTYFDANASSNSNNKNNNIIMIDDDEDDDDDEDAEDDDDDALMSDDSLHRIPLTGGDRLDIACQVALGMEFLAKNKVVHRDLAARNVLVSPDRTVKIADFGLSRDIYQENFYKRTGNDKLPIKWLALESMTHQVYTTQSDVWSYGILLYEIETLGGSPYPTIPTNDLLHLLNSGYRMEKPHGCAQELYNLMYSCWHMNPVERPNFSEIITQLGYLLCETPTADQNESIAASVPPPMQKEAVEREPVEAASEDPYLKPLY